MVYKPIILNIKGMVNDMTLKDIAEKAGVSMMTVSNVINGKHNRVSAKTIEHVNAIIEEYGYVPNLSARSLTNKTTNIIGIIISWGEADSQENYLENPYISTMIGTIEQKIRAQGYYILVRSIYCQTDLTTLLKNWSVDGIIFLYPNCDYYLESFLPSAPCPVAIFDSSIESPDLINICSDDRKGMYLSTKYMINSGHNQIAFVGDRSTGDVVQRRFEGYRQALEDSGIPFRPELVFPYHISYEGGIAAGKALASAHSRVTAAVTTADICAIGIMEGARLGGCRVPVDLSVMGYDNLPLCQYTYPKLSSVSQDITAKASMAAQLLLEKIQTGTLSQPAKVMMDVEIVARQSVVSLF